MKVGFVSLGCSKNLVDTEMCIGLFKKHKYEIVSNPKEAQIIVINTCGFIQSAKEEAINTILEMAQYKKKGNCNYLVVMGCLVKRYKEDLEKSIPEVDLWISLDEYDSLWTKVELLIKKKNPENDFLSYEQRTITTGDAVAYLKIAEGCSNYCTYCAIPMIRGKFVSRPIEEVIEEAKSLAKNGIKELIVIAQDTTKYGVDLYGESKLAELLSKLEKIEGLKWIRFLYAYPEGITDELIETVGNSKKICHYFDIPIQHISDRVLKRMNRKTTGTKIRKLIKHIREKIPDVILRTSLIVGFPGETKEEFEELYNFVQDVSFDKLGVFAYSKEDGTPAAKLDGQIHYKTKVARRDRIMALQQKVSSEKLKEKIGKTYIALIENKTEDGKYYIARTYMDVLDADGICWIKNTKDLKMNQFVKCEITDVLDYDLIGKIKAEN